MCCIHTVGYYSVEKERSADTGYCMDEPHSLYAMCKRPDTTVHCVTAFMSCLLKADVGIASRHVVGWGWKWTNCT